MAGPGQEEENEGQQQQQQQPLLGFRHALADSSGGGQDEAAAGPPGAKRRKIRKGTHSCWECKRRKIRCTFFGTEGSSTSTTICDGCRRRGTACVSQEFPDRPGPGPADGNGAANQVGDRLGRVESLVELLVKKASSNGGDGGLGGAGLTREMLCSLLVPKTPPGAAVTMAAEEQQQQPHQQQPHPGGTCFSPAHRRVSRGILSPPESCDSGRSSVQTSTPSNHLSFYYGHNNDNALEEEPLGGPTPPCSREAPDAAVHASGAAQCSPPEAMRPKGDKYEAIRRTLMEAWPCRKDFETIRDINMDAWPGTAWRLHPLLVSAPYSVVFGKDEALDNRSSTDFFMANVSNSKMCEGILDPPDPGSHPALIARKLLILATFLQHLHPTFNKELASLSKPHHEIMRSAAEAAITLVCGNEELVDSVEGVECIMLEAIYQSNAGNLRRSWLAWRRAMIIAQLMGMQRGTSSPTLRFIDGAVTRARTDPEYMWFRIIAFDRTLSLMLGLPQGNLDSGGGKNGFASPRAMAGDTAQGRLERQHAVISGRILQRNEMGKDRMRSGEDDDNGGGDGTHNHKDGSDDDDDMAVTQDIDMALQRASRSMPPRWWLTPELADAPDEVIIFKEILRLAAQFYHYHLLTQLHLPYMLRFTPGKKGGENGGGGGGGARRDDRYEYSRLMCVNASREVLSRFVSFRTFNRIACCCRAVDFYALTAAMALCLAHLDSHRREQQQQGSGGNILAHQRLSDRGMMERTLEGMEELARINGDVLSLKSSAMLRRMLAIEAEAASGGAYYSTSSSPLDEASRARKRRGEDDEHLNISYTEDEVHNVLRISVPYLGTIQIAREGVSRAPTVDSPVSSQQQQQQQQQQHQQQQQLASSSASQIEQPSSSTGGTPAPSIAPSPFFPSSLSRSPAPPSRAALAAAAATAAGHNCGLMNPDWGTTPLADFGAGPGFSSSSGNTSPPDDGSGFAGGDFQDTTDFHVPTLTAAADDWAFQGVDLAFFDSLMRGSGGGEGLCQDAGGPMSNACMKNWLGSLG